MEKVRLGILGFGNMGSGHFTKIMDGLCPEITVTAVADINPARLDAVREKTPKDYDGEEIKLFSTAEEMLDSGAIDACIVAVPHYDHPKYVMECFDRNIHVMCEKPAGVYTKQVRQMNDAAKNASCVFGMMFNQRTNCVYRKLRELVKDGGYGQIRRTNWIITNWYRPQFYYDSGAWRATWSGEGGGVLLNQCPHNLDLWQWICGMPKKVSANLHYGLWHDIEVEDDVTAYVEYENGATGVFVTSTGDAVGTNRFEIQMDKAKLVVENNELTVYEFKQSEPEFSNTVKESFPTMESIKFVPKTDGKNEQHVAVLNAFAGAILRGEPLIADGCEGVNGLTLSNAMHLSSWLDKPITLPFDEDLYYDELMKRVKTSRRKTNVNEAFADTAHSYNAGK